MGRRLPSALHRVPRRFASGAAFLKRSHVREASAAADASAAMVEVATAAGTVAALAAAVVGSVLAAAVAAEALELLPPVAAGGGRWIVRSRS